ncbi:MAG: hypothetical protein GY786_01220 [Proteobacteria bacterium]|nr:hypothetical protein [Pseudomonadota bacterium]
MKEGRTTKGFVDLSANAGKAKGTLSISDPITLFRSGDVKTSLDKLQGSVTYTPSDGFSFLNGSMEMSVRDLDGTLASSKATLNAERGSFTGTLNMDSEQKLFGTSTLETRFQLKEVKYEFILGDTFKLTSGDVSIRMLDIPEDGQQQSDLLTASLSVGSDGTASGSLGSTHNITLYKMSEMAIKLEKNLPII